MSKNGSGNGRRNAATRVQRAEDQRRAAKLGNGHIRVQLIGYENGGFCLRVGRSRRVVVTALTPKALREAIKADRKSLPPRHQKSSRQRVSRLKAEILEDILLA